MYTVYLYNQQYPAMETDPIELIMFDPGAPTPAVYSAVFLLTGNS